MEITPQLLKRFWTHVDITPGCWFWTLKGQSRGYGRFSLTRRSEIKSHRMSYIIHCGAVKDSDWVLHTCDTPRCVNPAHLYIGTAADNARDRVDRGRMQDQRGEKNPLTLLRDDEVRTIRWLLTIRAASQLTIGKWFGVSQMAVSRIARRVTWGHLL